MAPGDRALVRYHHLRVLVARAHQQRMALKSNTTRGGGDVGCGGPLQNTLVAGSKKIDRCDLEMFKLQAVQT